MNIIELKHVDFAYEDKTSVFHDFNYSFEKGKCTLIIGDNGAGKTTLFRILNGLSFPQKGMYLFDGIEIDQKYLKNNKNMKLFHKRIGYLFQNPDVMLFNGTVYDEIAFGPRQMGLKDEEVKQRTQDCLDLFGLEKLKDKAPYHLSGGQKKNVALASVLSLNPEVLILDEPFAGLDTNAKNQLIDLLLKLKAAGKTILIASHDPMIKESLADTYLDMNK